MKPYPPEDLFRAKKARRARLAKLPIDQKIDLIEQLRDAGKSLIQARETLGARSAAGKQK